MQSGITRWVDTKVVFLGPNSMVQSTDYRITSSPGVMLLREAEHRLSLFDGIAKSIHHPRRADRIRYQIDKLIRELDFSMADGCPAQDDVNRLVHD